MKERGKRICAERLRLDPFSPTENYEQQDLPAYSLRIAEKYVHQLASSGPGARPAPSRKSLLSFPPLENARSTRPRSTRSVAVSQEMIGRLSENDRPRSSRRRSVAVSQKISFYSQLPAVPLPADLASVLAHIKTHLWQ